jgi:hypothetical protein
MRKIVLRCSWLVALLALGCAPQPAENVAEQGQTFAQAMKLFCDVDGLAALSPDDDPIAIGQKRTAWITDKVENPDGIYLRTMLSVQPASDQAAELRKQAAKVGIAKCALADSVEKDGGGGLSP